MCCILIKYLTILVHCCDSILAENLIVFLIPFLVISYQKHFALSLSVCDHMLKICDHLQPLVRISPNLQRCDWGQRCTD